MITNCSPQPMATRSIIGAPSKPNGFVGRYCHWDGQPAVQVSKLLELVARDGLTQVRQTLVYDERSWSFIEPFQPKLDDKWHGADDYTLVDGYGVSYTEKDVELFTHKTKIQECLWADYLYVLASDKLYVFDHDGKKWVHKDSYEYIKSKSFV